MDHALRVLREELAVLRNTYQQVLADRALEGRSAMLAELSREMRELRDALSALSLAESERAA